MPVPAAGTVPRPQGANAGNTPPLAAQIAGTVQRDDPALKAYLAGTLSPDDVRKLFDRLRNAAEHGDAVAQNILAVLSAKKGDDAEAVKWYRKSAEQGYVKAQVNLGQMYFAGKGGVKKDEAEAYKWFLKAGEQGDSNGQNNVGAMDLNGWGS
jgi:TPR repeat protein